MRILILVTAISLPTIARASRPDEVAFTRFAYELAKPLSENDQAFLASEYFDALDRIGSKPVDKKGCLLTFDTANPQSPCLPAIMARGGTGGID